MTPGIPIRGYYPPDNKELIEQIRTQDAAWKEFAGAVADVIYVLAHNVAMAERLRDSIIGLMCAGSEKQIAMLETAAQMSSLGGFVSPRPSVEYLAHLCAERDQVQAQVDQLDRAKEAFGGLNGKMGFLGDPMSEMMEATVGVNIRQRLESLNEQISKAQAEMEKQ